MKPQDLFIGAKDFFSVLVPGTVLILILEFSGFYRPLSALAGAVTFGSAGYDSTLMLLLFLIAAYAVGTIVAGGASMLDALVDRKIKKRFSSLKPGSSKLSASRRMREAVFGWETEKVRKLVQAEHVARNLEARIAPAMLSLSVLNRPWSTKGFWWNYLRINCPTAIMELDLIEGYQKQYRSFIVVSVVVAAIYASRLNPWALVALACAFAMFSLYVRYRIRFARRIFEMAVAFVLSKDTMQQSMGAFWADVTSFVPEDRSDARVLAA